MRHILTIKSSLNGDQGHSSQLVNQYVQALQQYEQVELIERNLADGAIGHLTEAEFKAWLTPQTERSEDQQDLAKLSDILVAELQTADTIIVGVPMYNFGVPSTLKAWIDRIARAGQTFKYTSEGPVGLVKDKQVIVLASRGGKYAGTAKDTQTTYLKDFFAFIGMTDVTFIYAEGLAMGEADAAHKASMEKIHALVQQSTASEA